MVTLLQVMIIYTIDLNCFGSSNFINILKTELDNELARPTGHGSIALNHLNWDKTAIEQLK